MSQVNPIPEGFHTLTPYLRVRGAAEAIPFYEKALGAELVCKMPGPDGKKIMHAELKVGDSYFMLSDEMPEYGCPSPQSIGGSGASVHVYTDDVDGLFARAVEAGAKGTMPPANMFWGDRFAKIKDPYGHEWSIATHVEDVSPDEMPKRQAEAFAAMGKK